MAAVLSSRSQLEAGFRSLNNKLMMRLDNAELDHQATKDALRQSNAAHAVIRTALAATRAELSAVCTELASARGALEEAQRLSDAESARADAAERDACEARARLDAHMRTIDDAMLPRSFSFVDPVDASSIGSSSATDSPCHEGPPAVNDSTVEDSNVGECIDAAIQEAKDEEQEGDGGRRTRPKGCWSCMVAALHATWASIFGKGPSGKRVSGESVPLLSD